MHTCKLAVSARFLFFPSFSVLCFVWPWPRPCRLFSYVSFFIRLLDVDTYGGLFFYFRAFDFLFFFVCLSFVDDLLNSK